MGNCQAVDNASLILQTQNGRAERYYAPISAADVMKLHPGHYVALLLTTTFYSSPPSSSDHHHHHHHHHHRQPPNDHPANANQPLRVTRIKLLRPTDNLLLGHAYRLITTQEAMKGLKAKKNGKSNNYKNFQAVEIAGKTEAKSNCEASVTRSNQLGKTHHQMRKSDKQRPVMAAPANSRSSGGRPRGWHPSLNSISEGTN